MSKIKLLIHTVFKQGEIDSGTSSKSGISLYLSVFLKETLGFKVDERTLVRYHDAFITEIKDQIRIEPYKLDKLSQYVGYKDFSDFSRTFVKKEDDANKTTVKISVDENDTSLTDKIINIFITNEQNFKMPEFMKQNGFGMVEFAFVMLLLTGNFAFSNTKRKELKQEDTHIFSLFGNTEPEKEKRCMYWDKFEYKLADCEDDRPHLDLIPVNSDLLKYFKKITRKDTLTVENALGNTWYSKYNGEVEFFTTDGEDPDNGRELRSSTTYIIEKYAGIQDK